MPSNGLRSGISWSEWRQNIKWLNSYSETSALRHIKNHIIALLLNTKWITSESFICSLHIALWVENPTAFFVYSQFLLMETFFWYDVREPSYCDFDAAFNFQWAWKVYEEVDIHAYLLEGACCIASCWLWNESGPKKFQIGVKSPSGYQKEPSYGLVRIKTRKLPDGLSNFYGALTAQKKCENDNSFLDLPNKI